MATRHKVGRDEGISSIALKYGFAPATIWNHPENAELKKRRSDPNVLLPGDEVFVPDKTEKKVSAETGKLHRYRLVDVPTVFELQLLKGDEPRARLAYTLVIEGGKTLKGKTDAKGVLKEFVPATAKSGQLHLEGEKEPLELIFGGLDPVTEVIGVQQRLNNLGFDCGEPDNVFGPKTRDAVRLFQQRVGLEATGEVDDETRQRLFQLHESPEMLPPDDEGDGAAAGEV